MRREDKCSKYDRSEESHARAEKLEIECLALNEKCVVCQSAVLVVDIGTRLSQTHESLQVRMHELSLLQAWKAGYGPTQLRAIS